MKTKSPDIEFILKEKISKLIKVIGVGGAGSNAVNYMYEHQPLEHVEYIVCNTDLQALNYSPVPVRIQIGKQLTGGLGAGNKPETGRKAAQEDLDEVRRVLEDNTKMLFITAGMGGGTGTGAAPEIAKLAREMGILTVAVVTVPFQYEGPKRMKAAREGIEELRKYVDSLLVVNNQRLIEIHGDLDYRSAFHKSDEVLANAVKSVSKVIMSNYHINVDFNDVETILRNSGTAILGTASAEGENRAGEVIKKALDSPLLNDNRIRGAKNVLLLIISGTQTATVNEISYINEYIRRQAGEQVDIIMGLGQDPSLEKKLAVTVIATGFHPEKQEEIIEQKPPLVINIPVENDTPRYGNYTGEESAYKQKESFAQSEIKENASPSHTPDDKPENTTRAQSVRRAEKEKKQLSVFDFVISRESEESASARETLPHIKPSETEKEASVVTADKPQSPDMHRSESQTAEVPSTETEKAELQKEETLEPQADFFVERLKVLQRKKEELKKQNNPPLGEIAYPSYAEWNEEILENLKKYTFHFP